MDLAPRGSRVRDRLAERGLSLPAVAAPVAAYVPAVATGHHVHTSGLNALAAVESLAGDLDRVTRVVKLTGYVASDPAFTAQPAVINGASELLGELFGDAGTHARAAVGVAVLPLDAPVELDLLVELDGPVAD